MIKSKETCKLLINKFKKRDRSRMNKYFDFPKATLKLRVQTENANCTSEVTVDGC